MNGRRRRGASMLETMMVLCIMLFLFFSLFQVYSWVVAKIFCNYSAYYGGKGMALGYRLAIARRAARVAAIGISGRARDQAAVTTVDAERDAAQLYMTKGDASSVWYDYWYPRTGDDPQLMLGGRFNSGDNSVSTTVRLENAPLISPRLAIPLGISRNPDPGDTVSTYNHSALYLEE